MSVIHDYLPAISIRNYSYELPESSIASFPVEPKDHSRLLIYRDNECKHRKFLNLPSELPPDTLLIFNNTKVIPARLVSENETGKKIEVFLLKQIPGSDDIWECLVGNRKNFKPDQTLRWKSEQYPEKALEICWHTRELNQVKLLPSSGWTSLDAIEYFGFVPLPPYIKREATLADRTLYQTVFAEQPGAVAAPTASLHFTPKLVKELAENHIDSAFVTLHVGLGTFKPVSALTTDQHEMHSERFEVSLELLIKLKATLHKNIIPVGTTSMRVIESLYYAGVRLLREEENPFSIPRDAGFNNAYKNYKMEEILDVLIDHCKRNFTSISGETSIFILPGFQFKLTKALITNFHQPGSTLLLLVAALLGERWQDVYRTALERGYRFLSYGDSSLLFRAI